MAAPSSANFFGGKDEELKNFQINQPLQHSQGEGDSSSTPGAADASQRRRRNHWGNPSPDAEIVALSPKTLMATSRFTCEVCQRGFQREQNLQLHRRGHNLPWKLKQRTRHEIRKKEYICECGTTFTRRDSFTYHRSFCDAFTEKVARHTTNRSPYSSMATASIVANASNPGSRSLGSAAGSLIPGNDQQLSTPLLGQGASSPNSFTSLLSGHQELSTPLLGQGASSPNSFTSLLSGKSIGSAFQAKISFPSNTAPSNMFHFGFSGSAGLNNPQNDVDLNLSNSFSGGLMMNAETTHKILSSTLPSPQLSATALLQKASLLTGANSNNAALMKGLGSSLSGGMKFNINGGALGDGMSGGGGGRGGGSTLQKNGNYGGAGKYGRSGMVYLSDQMNAPYGGMMYNVNSADGMLVGEVNNNVVVEPQMNVQSEYHDKLTRDFLGGMVGDQNGNGIGTKSPDSEATTSAEARPFVPCCHRGF
ncbi:hypothetical protein POM88_015368 [Heracleum sosnowskyi]|uniref:C2H2-type domain-containing protein n=1 Tax=Heracleum sosnowskyi TaxID=360622 RepID=A0AAD8INJ8_9APIA|nr:hypothetical protein POM88_015368 [Heracleum sosnowskyi]